MSHRHRQIPDNSLRNRNPLVKTWLKPWDYRAAAADVRRQPERAFAPWWHGKHIPLGLFSRCGYWSLPSCTCQISWCPPQTWKACPLKTLSKKVVHRTCWRPLTPHSRTTRFVEIRLPPTIRATQRRPSLHASSMPVAKRWSCPSLAWLTGRLGIKSSRCNVFIRAIMPDAQGRHRHCADAAAVGSSSLSALP